MKTRVLFALTILALVSAGCPGPPKTVKVPNVVGLSRFQAALALADAKLTLGVVSEENDADIARDYVLMQDPAAGVSVNANSAVALTVSLGAEQTGGGEFTPGARVESQTGTVGATGGTVSGNVGSGGTAVTVCFPDNALPDDTEVTLAYDTGTVTPQEGQPGEAVIRLETPGVWYFEEPAEVTFALSAAKATNAVPVPYLIEDDGDWHVMDLVDLDWQNLTATVATYCPTDGSEDKAGTGCVITWVYAPLSKATVAADCAFRESFDGFQIANLGSVWNSSGECHGMVLFAQWYEGEKYWAEGGFFWKFMNVVDESSGLKGQDLIATRAHNSANDGWEAARAQAISDLLVMTPAEQAATILNALRNSTHGVELCLTDGSPNSHAVLAYRAETEATGTRFKIYDPNRPYNPSVRIQDWQGYSIFFNASSGQWEPYQGYLWALVAGTYGSMADHLRENFENILADAKDGFHSSKDAVVTITSHADGESVLDTTVVIGGMIHSGEMNVEEAWVLVFGEQGYRSKHKVTITESEEFLESISLKEGQNNIFIITMGRNASKRNLIIDNNMTRNRKPLVLHCLGSPSISGLVSELRSLGNPPIPNATVRLYRLSEYVDGTYMDTTTTNEKGEYAFYELDAGDYVVTAQADTFEIRLSAVEVGAEDGGAKASFKLGEALGCYTTGLWEFSAPTTGSWPELAVSFNGAYWKGDDGIYRACDYYTEGGWLTMTWWTDSIRTAIAKRFRGVCNREDGPVEGTYIPHLRGIVVNEDAVQTFDEFDAIVTSW